MDLNKKFKIKINSVKRLHKEQDHYESEINELKNKIKEMEKNEDDVHDIKKQNEMLEETINTKKRTVVLIKKYTDELKNLVNEHLEDGNIDSSIIQEINLIE